MGKNRRPGALPALCLAAAAGLLAGLALPPLGLPPLLWLALALLWAQAGSPHPWRGGALWGAAAVLVSHRWLLWLHPLDWIGVPGPLSLPICLALWLLIGGLAGLLVAAWVALARRLDPALPATALLLAALWGLAEVVLARGPLFWIGLGVAPLPLDRPLAGLAALGGAGALAALQLLLGWGLWRASVDPPARRRLLLGSALLVLVTHLAGAAALAAVRPGAGRLERLMVLQPAIPTRHKFEAARQRQLLGRLLDAQRQAAATPAATAAVSLLLPEGALALGQPLPVAPELEVLSGGFRQEDTGTRSSLLRFAPGDRDPVGWLDKHRLVPLGEWVPLAGLARWSGLSAVGGLEPGPSSRLLARPAGAIGVAICYELSDGASLAAASRAGALWLLASANLDPYPPLLQHQFSALAQLRAMETGRWLVSAANTGPSLVIDPAGRRVASLPAGRSAVASVELRQRSTLTPYDRWGDTPLVVLAAGAALARWRRSGAEGDWNR